MPWSRRNTPRETKRITYSIALYLLLISPLTRSLPAIYILSTPRVQALVAQDQNESQPLQRFGKQAGGSEETFRGGHKIFSLPALIIGLLHREGFLAKEAMRAEGGRSPVVKGYGRCFRGHGRLRSDSARGEGSCPRLTLEGSMDRNSVDDGVITSGQRSRVSTAGEHAGPLLASVPVAVVEVGMGER